MKLKGMISIAALAGGLLHGQTPFRITLLGTAGPSMSIERAEAGTLVQAGGETLLFDCGRGIPERLAQLGINNLSKVFLTHLHSDHTQGLPILWMSQWNGRGATTLQVWGPAADTDQPAGTADLTAMLSAAFATNTHIRRDLVEKWNGDAVLFDAREVQEGVIHESNGVKVTAFLVDHAPVKPAFGYRVDYAGRSVVLSGDTRPSDNLVKYAKGVDVLIHEVFLAAVGSTAATAQYHTLPEQAADVFNRAAPKLAVYSHIAPNVGDVTTRTRAAGYAGPLQVGSDLMTLDIGDPTVVKACASLATPAIASVTNDKGGDELLVSGTIVVTGAGFSAEGGNALRFTRMMQGQTAVNLDVTTGLRFEDLSPTRITADLAGKVAAGQWMISARNACGVASAGLAITLK